MRTAAAAGKACAGLLRVLGHLARRGARGGEKEIAATAFCVSVRLRPSVRQSSGFIGVGGGGDTNWFVLPLLFNQTELLILCLEFIAFRLVKIPPITTLRPG